MDLQEACELCTQEGGWRVQCQEGATYENTLMIGDKGVIKNTLRFEDEFARHKVLDLIGDLYLLGVRLRAHVIGIRSGHTLNAKLLSKLKLAMERWRISTMELEQREGGRIEERDSEIFS